MTGNAENGFELSVERYIDAPPHIVWSVWVERIEEWFCPKPWTTELIAMDLRPGGRIVTTDAYRAGWIPQKPFMTGYWEMLPEGKGTRYRAGAWHWDEEAMKQHDQMGFVPGWSAVADQLAALAEAEAKGG